MKKKNLNFTLLTALLLALCLMAVGCSGNQLNVAAKSIITAQEVYDATMSACADAYRDGVLSDEGKAQVIIYGGVAHDAIALAQTSLIAALDASGTEAESKLAAAVTAMKTSVVDLVKRAIALGVSVSDAVAAYKEG